MKTACIAYALFLSADAVSSFDFSPLVNLGAMGVVLAWMLWKAEPRMRAVESAIDRQSAAILILLLEIDRTTPEAKRQATVVMEEIKAARRARGEPEDPK